VGMGVGGHLGLGERNRVAIPAAACNQVRELLGADHAFMDLDVGNLMLGVQMDTSNVRVLAELSFHLFTACGAQQRAGRDGQRCHPLGC